MRLSSVELAKVATNIASECRTLDGRLDKLSEAYCYRAPEIALCIPKVMDETGSRKRSENVGSLTERGVVEVNK